ncbi:MAG: M1 family metallopeptidase, partial [bacterium]|nr:M1 family metallopeptidase [bacterium]
KVEKDHLKHLTGGPSISETFSKMVLRFTDDTYKAITAAGEVRQVAAVSEAEGPFKKVRKLLRKGKNYLKPNIAAFLMRYNLDRRLLIDVTWPGHEGFFYTFFKGKKYGDMVFTIDPLGAQYVEPEEVMLACLGERNLGIWIAEHRQEYYKPGSTELITDIDNRLVDMEHFDIDATPHKSYLDMAVTARFKALADGVRVIPFDLFPRLRMGAVTDAEGGLLPFIQEKHKEDADFAVILPEGLEKGKQYTLTFEYQGKDAVIALGNGNFTLAARTNWYPNTHFGDRATFNITLKTPANLEVVATGNPVDREVKGKILVSRWKSDVPLAVAGFNYGEFKKSVVEDKELNLTIESYANKEVPEVFRGLSDFVVGSINPVRMMEKMRAEAQVGIRVYSKMFGPMPFDRIAITQQPFPTFGQAWPTLVYMPIISYFSSTQLAQVGLAEALGFIKYVCAHEVGHQWWGHAVGWKSYRSQWLSEAFAQLSASMFAQVVYKGTKFVEFWKDERRTALRKNRKRKCPSKIGSITLSQRLNTGRTGNVYNAAIYSKGAFVAHMLRMLMWDHKTGDKKFSAMLQDFLKTHYNSNVSTEDFKRMVEKHITPQMNLDRNGKMDWFFDQWLHGTQIPHYTLKSKVKKAENGKFILTVSITQSKVDDSFKMRVPIYAEFANKKVFRLASAVVKGNSTSQEFNIPLPRKPKRVLLCAMEDVLCTIEGR